MRSSRRPLWPDSVFWGFTRVAAIPTTLRHSVGPGNKHFTELLQGAAQRSRHMRLREPRPRGDLRLAEVLDEAQAQKLSLARMQGSQRRVEHHALLRVDARVGDVAGLLERHRRHAHARGLEAARDAHRRRPVAQVVADLARDRRRGERGERDAAAGVVAVDRLDQADRADLDQVLERLAAPGEAAGDGADERQMGFDQLAAGGGGQGPKLTGTV